MSIAVCVVASVSVPVSAARKVPVCESEFTSLHECSAGATTEVRGTRNFEIPQSPIPSPSILLCAHQRMSASNSQRTKKSRITRQRTSFRHRHSNKSVSRLRLLFLKLQQCSLCSPSQLLETAKQRGWVYLRNSIVSIPNVDAFARIPFPHFEFTSAMQREMSNSHPTRMLQGSILAWRAFGTGVRFLAISIWQRIQNVRKV